MNTKNTFLVTENDKLSYLRVLINQMQSDGTIERRELQFIKMMLLLNGINEELFKKASKLYDDKKLEGLDFSGKPAVILAVFDAIRLSSIDDVFSLDEINEIRKLMAAHGISLHGDLPERLKKCVGLHMESNKKLEELLNEIESISPDDGLANLFPDMADKRAFVRYFLQNSYVDGSSTQQEKILLSMLGRLLELDFDQLDDIVAEYENNPSAEPVFSSEKKARIAVRESLRMIIADGSVDEKEKELLKNSAKKYGISLNDNLFDNLSEVAAKDIESNRMIPDILKDMMK